MKRKHSESNNLIQLSELKPKKSFTDVRRTTPINWNRSTKNILSHSNPLSNTSKTKAPTLAIDIWIRIYSICQNRNIFSVNTELAKLGRDLRRAIKFNELNQALINTQMFITTTIRSSRNLQVLDFSNCGSFLSPSLLYSISQMRSYEFPLNLQVLSLKSCKLITDKSARYFLSRLKNLRALDLRGCPLLTTSTLRIISTYKRLEFLAFGSSRYQFELNDLICSIFSKLKGDNCDKENNTMENPTSSLILSKDSHSKESYDPIIPLKLFILNNSTISNFNFLLHPLSNLTYLDLSKSSSLSSTQAIKIQPLPMLTLLNLSSCPIDASMILYIIEVAPNIKLLDLTNTSLDSPSLIAISKKLVYLEELIVGGCLKIENGSIRELLKNLNDLKKLDISGCHSISPQFLESPLQIKSGSKFKYLGIQNCSFSIEIIMRYLFELGITHLLPLGHKLSLNEVLDFSELYKDSKTMWGNHFKFFNYFSQDC